MERDLKLNYLIICICLMIAFSGYTFPSKAPHVHIVNDGVAYDIYFAGSNFRNAFVYENNMLINTYSSNITGYVEISGVQRTATFPVYDYGYIRTNDSYPATYVYLNNITECQFVGFTESGWWQDGLEYYLLIVIAMILFLNFLRGRNV